MWCYLMELEQIFGEILKESRLGKGLSQEELAFRCGLDRTYISLMERGKRKPTITTIFVLADALEVLPSHLIALAENRYKG